MLIIRFHRMIVLRWSPSLRQYFSTQNNDASYKLCKHFSITQEKAEFIYLKQPYLNKLDEITLEKLIDTVNDLGFAKEALINDPLMFSILPITLRFRHRVLTECGFENITPKHIVSYLPLMKRRTIGELKRSGDLAIKLNVEQRLASFMTQWPISLTSVTCDDNHDATLYNLRLKILQRYLELVLDLPEDEFHRGLKTYPTIKHRPLEIINETLNILQSVVTMSNKKIKANLYLLHVDPYNLKQLIYNFRSIGGIDIKEILRLYPKLATKNYDVMVEIRNVLQDYGIGDEAQRRCFSIYTLSPETIRHRLEEAKSIPEFQAFKNHPRFLKMIHYKNTAMHRLKSLYNNKKLCLSLNVLSGSSAHYETFEKAPGDRLGKGKDLVFCISQYLGELYSLNQIRNIMKRHPFWISVPLVQIQSVCQQLSKEFTLQDIFENCPILLYPWSQIKKTLDILEATDNPAQLYINDVIDVGKLNKSQILSLVLYYLEKKHYFTGNGVWDEEKRNVQDMTRFKDLKYDIDQSSNSNKALN